MKSLSDYRNDIELAIKDLNLPSENPLSLYEPIKYALSSGGKRLRPVLTLMAADAFGNKSSVAVIPALGIETFHNFTLLHDDVMDKSDTRRGRQTVHKKYDENTAILSGDTMLTLATEYISSVDTDILRNVLDTFNKMAINVYEGQALDMDFEKQTDIPADDYIEMIGLKTGALLGAAVKIGALIGGATETDADMMYDFGFNIGIAFQIQDDWLDTFGDPSSFGKSIGGDINNGKKTFLYVNAMRSGNQFAEALKVAYEIPAGEKRISTVKKLFESLDITETCKKAVNHYLKLALKSLNRTNLSDDSKDGFHSFAEKLIGRKK